MDHLAYQKCLNNLGMGGSTYPFLMVNWLSIVCLVTQLCPTLCDTMNFSPSGSSVLGIFQARLLELVAISFCKAEYSNQLSFFSFFVIFLVVAPWLVMCVFV